MGDDDRRCERSASTISRKSALTQNHLDTLKITCEPWWDESSRYLKGNVVRQVTQTKFVGGMLSHSRRAERGSLRTDSSVGQTEYYSSCELDWTGCLTAGSDMWWHHSPRENCPRWAREPPEAFQIPQIGKWLRGYKWWATMEASVKLYLYFSKTRWRPQAAKPWRERISQCPLWLWFLILAQIVLHAPWKKAPRRKKINTWQQLGYSIWSANMLFFFFGQTISHVLILLVFLFRWEAFTNPFVLYFFVLSKLGFSKK